MVQQLINWLLNIPILLAPFFNWLISPIGNGINIPPLALFGIGGFAVIFIMHVIHLVNPMG